MYRGTVSEPQLSVVWLAVRLTFFAAAALECAAADGPARWVETVLPGLYYSPACTSSIDLQNLGERPVTVEIEAHRESGALVALTGHRGITARLEAGDNPTYKLQIADETTGAWVKLRERVPSPSLSPVVAIKGETECVDGDELRTAPRQAGFATRNPWYAGDLSELRRGEIVLLINTTERTALASACYSSGSFYAVPEESRATEFKPLCSTSDDVQVPPYGSHEFPLERGGNTHFELKAKGDAVVLQMLRPTDPAVRLFTVDSTITFGSEAAPSAVHQKE